MTILKALKAISKNMNLQLDFFLLQKYKCFLIPTID